MIESIVIALLVGTALGVFYFYGLWWTVRRLNSHHAAIWLPVSFLVRGAVVVGGFYLVMDGRWEPLLAALAGFIAARIVVISRLKKESAE